MLQTIALAASMELIETLWNVNRIDLYCLVRLRLELIETLWNVNKIIRNIRKRILSELIETLWNVNRRQCAYFCAIFRINRNIVECKCQRSGNHRQNNNELIETLWNVNLFALSLPPLLSSLN